MGNYQVTYLDKIYKAIYDMPIGGEFIIADNVQPGNRESFTKEIILYIQLEYGHAYGWDLELSKTLNKFRKIAKDKR